MKKLKKIIYALMVIFFLIWSSSFVPVGLELISYILMIFYFIIGIVLLFETLKSRTSGKLKGFLFLTGLSSILLIVFICIGILEFKGSIGFYELIKDFFSIQIDLFLTTVFIFAFIFWFGAIRSIQLLNRKIS